MSNLATAISFVRLRIDDRSINLLRDTLQDLQGVFDSQRTLEDILRQAGRPIQSAYKNGLRAHDATGNLSASTRIKTKRYSASGVAIAVVGPVQTGREGATQDRPSGNHAWLFEFGSNGRRSPSTRSTGRKTYVNVHQLVNRRMRLAARLEDSDTFASRGRGYYFLMSSWKEPTRQRRAGKGYSHDFLPGKKVYTLQAGETYGAMPAYSLMQNSIRSQASRAQSIIRSGLIDAINRTVGARL